MSFMLIVTLYSTIDIVLLLCVLLYPLAISVCLFVPNKENIYIHPSRWVSNVNPLKEGQC